MKRDTLINLVATQVTKHFIDQGKLVEAGFAAYCRLVYPQGVPLDKVNPLREAFLSGAEHLFSSIMCTLDPGEEPTTADLKRMDKIADEVEAWRNELFKRYDLPLDKR